MCFTFGRSLAQNSYPNKFWCTVFGFGASVNIYRYYTDFSVRADLASLLASFGAALQLTLICIIDQRSNYEGRTKSFTTVRKSILKSAELQCLVVNCCKIRKI